MGGKVKYPKACKSDYFASQPPSDNYEKYGFGQPANAELDCNLARSNCTIRPSAVQDKNYPKGMPLLGEQGSLMTRQDGVKVWSTALIDWMIGRANTGDVSPVDYPGAQADIVMALRGLDGEGVRGQRVLVAGSIAPWMEGILLKEGASHTTTTDYNPPVSTDPRCATVTQAQLLASGETWPFVVSFSSLEHDGQGRYGDPLDPDGDLAAMKEYWQMLAPGGKLLLAVPVDMHDNFFWISQRMYGPHRLPLLLRGWKWQAITLAGKIFQRNESFILGGNLPQSINGQPMMILEKVVNPNRTHNRAFSTLEDAYELTATDAAMGLSCAGDETLSTPWGVLSNCAVPGALAQTVAAPFEALNAKFKGAPEEHPNWWADQAWNKLQVQEAYDAVMAVDVSQRKAKYDELVAAGGVVPPGAA